MRHRKWKIIGIMIALLLSRTSVFSEGLNGWLNLTSNNSKTIEGGEQKSAADSLNQNYYLNLENPVTPMLSYQFNFRANLMDSDVTDEKDKTTSLHLRVLEPAITLFLRNSVYDLNAGYERQEKWTTSHLTNESRETSDFYFSRFNLTPRAFPSLTINLDRHKDIDHGPEKKLDRTNDTYSVNSAYELPSPDLKFRYYLSFIHNVDKTPLSVIEKTINDNFNGNYNVGYDGALWRNKANYSLGYQGYYSRSKNQNFVSRTGEFVFLRTAAGGFSGKDANVQIALGNNSSLIDPGFIIPAGINLSTDLDNQIGISILFEKSVDRLFVYVNKDITADSNLLNKINWRVFKNGFNQAFGWQEINIKGITPKVYDVPNNIYRYEIEFESPQNALYFKAINTAVSSVSGVEVTQIEAYGTDNISNKKDINVSTSFNQRLNLNAYANPFTKLNVSVDYSIERMDQNPESFTDSVSGIFTNIFSDPAKGGRSNSTSNITRNYGIGAVWMTHRLLTTTARFQKNENLDNREEINSYSDTYQLSFNSAPLPTLDTGLSYTRNERYNFNEKDSTSDSYLLSIGARLFKNINMINDLGYTRSETFSPDTSSSIYQLNGTVDAQITRKITGNLNYGFNRVSSKDTSAIDSEHALMIINYQPGRFINLSGNINYTDSGGDVTIAEGITTDWLPLPVVRLNLGYQHSDADPVPTITDTISGNAVWYVTKFADVRLSSSYTREVKEVKTENYNLSANINCRF